ncbi:MAG: NAD(P)-dependent oxidoreductase [Alphaproteobacteria bacterium]|jgi:D-3-phosphoglycerate dehydrogenase|nr:NAD(P)-dependent oxidoreductase [Alphaproteobacteria bacterium]MDP7182546.1 NAD(P)-dependent oxidoreductase [Alphaproteobacteria bacterium]HJO89193.1 NAD(P)-dependent oxidoreductase [Alphaproteobacteria bacterium]
MSGVRILNVEPDGYSPRAREILDTLGEVTEKPLDRDGLLNAAAEYEVLITRFGHPMDKELFAAAPGLRALVSATTGLDHIDLEAAAVHGVTVLSLQGEMEFLEELSATAELTWGLLLSLLRRIPQAIDSVKEGGWDRDIFRGNELRGKRLGILGLGRLGRMVAEYGRAFGMAVAAHDPYVSDWSTGVDLRSAAEDLMEDTQVLSIHVPLNDETRGLMDGAMLARLPEGAVLINTSRGAVVDEAALLAALGSGHLAGAGLDVVAKELSGGPSQAFLAYARAHDNLIITPHMGGATVESMEKVEVFMAQKLARFLESGKGRE